MNLENLRAFVAAAEDGNISAAARRLGRSQSATSTGISNLEIDLGITLFDRSGHTAVLTQQARDLLPFAISTLRAANALELKAESLSSSIEGRISIFVDDSININRLMEQLGSMTERFPNTDFDITITSSPDVIAAIEDGSANIGIAISQDSSPEHFFARTVSHVRFILITSKSHPLAQKRGGVSNIDLVPHRQIRTHGSGGRIPNFPQSYSASLWRCQRYTDVMALVRHGFGWGIVPDCLCFGKGDEGIVELEHEYGRAAFSWPIDMVWPKSKSIGPALEYFLRNTKSFGDQNGQS